MRVSLLIATAFVALSAPADAYVFNQCASPQIIHNLLTGLVNAVTTLLSPANSYTGCPVSVGYIPDPRHTVPHRTSSSPSTSLVSLVSSVLATAPMVTPAPRLRPQVGVLTFPAFLTLLTFVTFLPWHSSPIPPLLTSSSPLLANPRHQRWWLMCSYNLPDQLHPLCPLGDAWLPDKSCAQGRPCAFHHPLRCTVLPNLCNVCLRLPHSSQQWPLHLPMRYDSCRWHRNYLQ